MHFREGCFGLFALIAGSVMAPSAATGQVDISNWPQVRVGVVAIDKSGQPFLDLKGATLDVEENGHQAAVQSVDSDARPRSICVVVDTSSSSRVSLALVKSSVLRLLQQLPPQDEVCLATFDLQATLLQPLSLRRDRLVPLVAAMHAGGGTALYDSLSLISDAIVKDAMVKDARNPDRTIILFSDGDDNYSRTSESDLVSHLRKGGSPVVYMIRVPATSHLRDSTPFYVQALGGLAFFPDSLSALDASLDQVLAVMKSSRSITYISPEPRKDGRIRRIRIRVQGANKFVAHSPDGYFAPSQ